MTPFDILLGLGLFMLWIYFCNWLCFSDTTYRWLQAYNDRRQRKADRRHFKKILGDLE